MITPKKEKSFDPRQIPKVVKDAGFSPQEVELRARGKVEKWENLLALRVPGFTQVFILEGGRKIEEFKRLPKLLGREVTVRGVLHPEHGDRPPGLTVESYEIAQSAK